MSSGAQRHANCEGNLKSQIARKIESVTGAAYRHGFKGGFPGLYFTEQEINY